MLINNLISKLRRQYKKLYAIKHRYDTKRADNHNHVVVQALHAELATRGLSHNLHEHHTPCDRVHGHEHVTYVVEINSVGDNDNIYVAPSCAPIGWPIHVTLFESDDAHRPTNTGKAMHYARVDTINELLEMIDTALMRVQAQWILDGHDPV